jgi:glucokinase
VSEATHGAAPGPYAIGIDVGGTKIAGGIVNLTTGQVLARRQIATLPEQGGEAVLERALAIDSALHQAAAEHGLALQGTGLGVCELVDPHGNVTSSHTVAWGGLPIRERLAERGPAVVEADVRAHALAEAWYGAGQGYRLVVFVTVGTGISSCLVQDGRPLAGARGNALVLASSPLSFVCAVCGAAQHPILEEIASGPALSARYEQAGAPPGVRSETILAAARDGEPAAIEIVRSAGVALGASIGWLVNVLDPQIVIVGGGLGTAGGLYWENLVESARAHIWAPDSRTLPIVTAALGPEAGLVGAAAALNSTAR